MEASGPPSPYTAPQKKMRFYHDTAREALLFRKYYAQRASWCKFWNSTFDFLIAAAACTELTSNTVFKDTTWGPAAVNWLLIFSVLATIVRPMLHLGRKASESRALQKRYLILHQRLSDFNKGVELRGTIAPEDEDSFQKLRERFNKLGELSETRESELWMKWLSRRADRRDDGGSVWLPPA